MLVVIDTNILVSAFWSKQGNPSKIIGLVQNRVITPCYDYRILAEYKEVLMRSKFKFEMWEVCDLLAQIQHDGLSVSAKTLDVVFVDEEDIKFYEVAKQCSAALITGNIKHFPNEDFILTPAQFLGLYSN